MTWEDVKGLARAPWCLSDSYYPDWGLLGPVLFVYPFLERTLAGVEIVHADGEARPAEPGDLQAVEVVIAAAVLA